MEIIVYLLLQLGILFGNPTSQNPASPVKSNQIQKTEVNMMSVPTTNRDGGSGTWGDNG
ncbi:hypothetical protein [Pontibacter qinzhouensis]|uniref:hypothetical protein n=1 Tax=Pontibacter qinzhouensis TaxID=2603253 RepID=UPI00165094B6|nr:hypothetical protein [Pontibacter qinzhouensis]